jgi:hypothetical protein
VQDGSAVLQIHVLTDYVLAQTSSVYQPVLPISVIFGFCAPCQFIGLPVYQCIHLYLEKGNLSVYWLFTGCWLSGISGENHFVPVR